MARVEINRPIQADPAGVALLLADPAARDLWPRGRGWVGAPQRSGVGFVCDVVVADPPARGRLTIRVGADGPGRTDVRLVLQALSADGALAWAAERFLTAVAEAAYARSSAA